MTLKNILLIGGLVCSAMTTIAQERFITFLAPDSLTPIAGVRVLIEDRDIIKFSRGDGQIELGDMDLPLTIHAAAFSYKPVRQNITAAVTTIVLAYDPLHMETIVISDYSNQQTLFESSNSTTILSNPKERSLSGIPQLISEVPGVYIDGSLGEVFSRVYTRGIAASAEDDIGWYYQSLQENGLPVSSIQYNYFTPDLFLRTDLMTQKFEAVRGGKVGILNQNSPGGAFNFIVQPFSETVVKTTLGLKGQNNTYYRLDGVVDLPLKSEAVKVNVGGFYRFDNGPRNTDGPWSRGGQLRTFVQKRFGNGVLNMRAKYLNDHVNRYTGVAAVDWDDPTPAFGQDFNSTALMLPDFESTIPGDNGYTFNSGEGIHVRELALEGDYTASFDNWTVDARFKYARKESDWNTSFANAPLGLESFLPYFLSGAAFPFGVVSFRDAKTGSELAVVDNSGALAVFQGGIPSFDYISGHLPNDALMGIAPWKKTDALDEGIVQLGISKQWHKHDVHFGVYGSVADLDYFTNASYAYATFEPEPRLLTVALTDFYGNQLDLSDPQGMSNYGGLFFEKGRFDVNQLSVFAHDHFRISNATSFDVGIRFEHINHNGVLDVPQSFEAEGGLDGNPATDYDNAFMMTSGQSEAVDFSYQTLSFSAGISQKINEDLLIFLRHSQTKKAPELNVYIQNFSSLPIERPGDVQDIIQSELGFRMKSSHINFSATVFLSTLDNIAVSDFLFDQQSNQVFYTPVQVNKTRTIGTELEWTFSLNHQLSLWGTHTFQHSQAVDYTVYNPNGTADTSDDMIIDFSGNKQPHVPSVMSRFGIKTNWDRLESSLDWSFMGKRFGNVENAITLPPFSTFNMNVSYALSSRMDISFQANNILNASGLMNFFGPNTFGASANDASADFIRENPEGSFVVFPILPRALYLSFSVRL